MNESRREALVVSPLADRPEHLSTVAQWQFDEWGFLEPGDSVDRRAAKLRQRLQRDRLPLTLIATAGDRLVGSADLVARELADYDHLTPWLSCVFVDPMVRCRGIGTRLTAEVEGVARRLGYREIHLCTWNREAFYRGRGWSTTAEFTSHGVRVAVMVKRLSD